jgi:hypothetical protein
MTHNFDAPHGGLVLMAHTSRRQRSVRRRWMAAGVILSVALAGGILGQMSGGRGDASHPLPSGPLSYLPQ